MSTATTPDVASRRRNVLMLTKYTALGASSRYRALQYIPYLRDQGWNVHVEALLSDTYLQHLYTTGEKSGKDTGIGFYRRLRFLLSGSLKNFDVIYVQYEVFPYLPAWLERPIYKRPVVVDYDDAVFISYEKFPGMRSKIPRVIQWASEVIVGNECLRSYACGLSKRLTVIPTVIDLDRYHPRTDYSLGRRREIVIGWIGTPVTAAYLLGFGRVLQALSHKYPIVMRCVGAAPSFTLPGVRTEVLPWSEQNESDLIRTFDLGVMPLADDSFSRGKCGLKLIQYMASGVPSIGERLGANTDIISDGVNGFLASGEEEYVRKVDLLLSSLDLRERLGRNGRSTVERSYSLQVRSRDFCEVFERCRLEGQP